MKYVYLGQENISCLADVHEAFAKALGFPEYYGRNFDALHDMLGELSAESLVIITDIGLLKERLGEGAYSTLIEVLTDAWNENPKLKLRFFA